MVEVFLICNPVAHIILKSFNLVSSPSNDGRGVKEGSVCITAEDPLIPRFLEPQQFFLRKNEIELGPKFGV